MAMLFDDGFSAFDDRLAAIEEKGASKMDKFVAQEAEVIIGKIKDNTPTQTGRLKNGWKHSRAIQGKQRFTTTSNMPPTSSMAIARRRGGMCRPSGSD